MQEKSSSLNLSVFNAFEIVNYLISKDWCRLKDIAGDLNMDLAKAHRLLNTMVYQDYVEYDHVTRRYRLGLKFYTISYHMTKSGSLIAVAREHMEWAADQLKETINLGVLSNSKMDVKHIYKVYGNSDAYRIDTPIGEDVKSYASALGKCMLAYMSPGEQSLVYHTIKFEKFTESTITSVDDLVLDLQKIKSKGYAIDDGEYHPNIFCVATPIFSNTGSVNASISVTTMRPVIPERIDQFYEVLAETARRISKTLGYKS